MVLLVEKRFIARVLLNYTTVKKGLTLYNYASYCDFNVYFINSSGKWSISKGLDSNNDVAMIISENVSTMTLVFFIAGYCFQNCQGIIIQLSNPILKFDVAHPYDHHCSIPFKSDYIFLFNWSNLNSIEHNTIYTCRIQSAFFYDKPLLANKGTKFLNLQDPLLILFIPL